jgi:hypothetical protein
MSRHFSVPTVLRMVRNRLLSEVFQRLGLGDANIPWERLKERDIEFHCRYVAMLTRSDQDRVETAFRVIFDLACRSGIDAIFEAAATCGEQSFSQAMPHELGTYDKAAWTWLHFPEVFDRAAWIHHIDCLSWWRKRRDLPQRAPDTSHESLRRLGSGISQILLERGLGHQCTVEHYRRANGLDYFFAYPDDFAENIAMHDPEGVLTPQLIRKTFAIVLAFNAEEGTLELCGKVSQKFKLAVERLFASFLLDHELTTWDPGLAYNLEPLRDSSFPLVIDPEDCLRVHIRSLEFEVVDSGDRIRFESCEERTHTYYKNNCQL